MQKKILGIDPGTNICGFAVTVLDGQGQLELEALGSLKMDKLKDAHYKLHCIYDKIQALIEQHSPTIMAIEAPFYGKNVQSMLKLGRAQGVAIAAGMAKGLFIKEYSPKRVKKAITGNGNCNKNQVAYMLEQLFKLNFSEYENDTTDALAVAVCHYFQIKDAPDPLRSTAYSGWKQFLDHNPGRTL